MSEAAQTPTSIEGVTSLYRRFRPGRFAELSGQEHIVRALQGAVKNDRVSHAYLFSGPRGTGKTTTARILAKALNCEHPVDGDACNECPSCVAITKGASLDVVELDAASNNGVQAIRDITSGAWTNTPGRWRVYIFDEVHQLTPSASAALLKTLEEPPNHVVFVLATTDPHKVLPTIRSRTQHLEFRLLSGDTLATLLDNVQKAAGLGVDGTMLDVAVRMGRGSARDALSALDQLVATGTAEDARPSLDTVLGALRDEDPTAAILALATLHGEGWEVEHIAESLTGELRQIFLLLLAPEASDAVNEQRDRLGAWGQQLGLAKTVRSLETVGRTMREMKSAPEKIAVLEVALVRLCRPDLDASIAALDERLTKLERSGPRSAPVAPVVEAAPTLRPIGQTDAPKPAPVVERAAPSSTPASTAPAPAPAPDTAPAPAPAPAPRPASAPDLGGDAASRFTSKVVPSVPQRAQMILKSSRFISMEGQTITLELPTTEMRDGAVSIMPGLLKALEHEFKAVIDVQWVVSGSSNSAPAPAAVAPKPAPVEAEEVIVDVANDEAVEVTSVDEHIISQMFPGAEPIS